MFSELTCSDVDGVFRNIIKEQEKACVSEGQLELFEGDELEAGTVAQLLIQDILINSLHRRLPRKRRHGWSLEAGIGSMKQLDGLPHLFWT